MIARVFSVIAFLDLVWIMLSFGSYVHRTGCIYIGDWVAVVAQVTRGDDSLPFGTGL